jgi:uroporphyrinogen-III synthase
MSHELAGLVILNTRPLFLGASQNFTALMESHGGKTYPLPLQDIKDYPFVMPNLNDFQKIVFVSQAAVYYFFHHLKEAIPHDIKIIAIGKATAKAIEKHHVTADFFSEDANSESLLKSHEFQDVDLQSILWVKGTHGRTLIGEVLKKKGAHVQELLVYESIPKNYSGLELAPLWEDVSINMILVTSEQAFRNLIKLAPKHWLSSKDVICLSQRLADIAKNVIQGHILISRPDKILETLINFKAKHG